MLCPACSPDCPPQGTLVHLAGSQDLHLSGYHEHKCTCMPPTRRHIIHVPGNTPHICASPSHVHTSHIYAYVYTCQPAYLVDLFSVHMDLDTKLKAYPAQHDHFHRFLEHGSLEPGKELSFPMVGRGHHFRSHQTLPLSPYQLDREGL